MKKCFAALALAALALGMVPAVSGAASSDDAEFFKLAGQRNWLTYADARPVSPYFGIPGELRPTAPFARSYLDASPGRSECFASLYYPDEVVEEGVLQTTGHYENKTMARSNNPDLGRGMKQEFAPFGRPGPHATTENPSRTDCNSEALSGAAPAPDQLMVDAGYAKTHAVFDRDKTVTDEAVSRVEGIRAGPLRIGNLETVLKLDYHLEGEPTISYAMSIVGLEVDGNPVANVGGKGIVLGGQQVAPRDLIDQFNDQVGKNGAALKDKAVADYLRLVAPRVDKHDDGGVDVAAPAVEIGQFNKFRENQQGDHFGLRLGYATAYALLNSLGELGAPDAGTDLSATTPGTPVESTPGGSAGSSPGNSPLSSSTSPGSQTPTLSSGAGFLSGSGDLGTPSRSASSALKSGGYSLGAADTSSAAAATSAGTAPPATASNETALPTLGAVTAPGAKVAGSAQLAAAESRRAARNTANGLLGGILVLVGSLVWVGGMLVLGRLRPA
jgi:hypothetical protein